MKKECKEYKALKERYLDGELSSAEKAVFLAHLDKCPLCKRETTAEEEMLEAIKIIPPYVPSDSLIDKTTKKVFFYHKPDNLAIFDFLAEHQSQLFNSAVAVALVLLLFLNFSSYYKQKEKPPAASSEVVIKENMSAMRPVKFVLNVSTAPEKEIRSVAVVGDFNGWNPQAGKMLYDNGLGAWVLELKLSPGMYDYMYVINDKLWIADPQANKQRDDGFGGKNSVLEI